MGRTFQAPGRYLDDVVANTQGTPIPLGQSGGGFCFHNSWNFGGGTLSGTLVFEASNDPEVGRIVQDEFLTTTEKATAFDAARWVDVTSVVSATDPTTGDGNSMEVVNNARFWWFRLRLEGVAGTGTFSSYIATHGDG